MIMAEQILLITDQNQIDSYADEIIDFTEGKRNHDNAKVGQSFVVAERNVKAVQTRINRAYKEVPDKGGFIVKKIVEEEVTKDKFIKIGYSVWEVIQPRRLLPYNGLWSRATWIPEVLHDSKWIKASNTDCENWNSIPEENKRVLLNIGIIEESV